MPGIFGLITDKSWSDDITKNSFNKMCSYLKHTSFYSLNTNVVGNLHVGSVSINSTFSYNEIIISDKKYIVLIDGFVYKIDGKKLHDFRVCKTELLHRIVEIVTLGKPADLLSIEGSYSIAVCNICKKEFFLFNDILSPRRLYYYFKNNTFAFSPEVKGISFLPFFKKMIDREAVSDFISYSYILGDKTLLTDIKSLPSASLLKYNYEEQDISIQKYWKPVYKPKKGKIDDFADEAYDLLSTSVTDKLPSKTSIISPISGGLDSRLILGILKNLPIQYQLNAVTYGQRFSDEYKYGKKVCRSLNVQNHMLIDMNASSLIKLYKYAAWFSEGMIPISNCHLLLFPLFVSIKNDYLFNGIYGGPSNYCALYYSKRNFPMNNLTDDEKAMDIANVMALPAQILSGMFSGPVMKDVEKNVINNIKSEFTKFKCVSDEYCFQRDAFFIENRMRRFINQSSLHRFFWEEQLPLTSYALYSFYLQTPAEMLVERELLKNILIRKFPKLASIPDANTGYNLFKKSTSFSNAFKKFGKTVSWYSARLSKGKISMYDKSTYSHYEQWFRNDKNTHDFYYGALFDNCEWMDDLIEKKKLIELYNHVIVGKSGFKLLERLTTYALWWKYYILEEEKPDINTLIETKVKNENG
jgi:asparagine synthase (glutamine-hydrolysing)